MTKKHSGKKAHGEYWAFPNMTEPVEIALYYGFTPISPLKIDKQDIDRAKSLGIPEREKNENRLEILPAELFALLRKDFSEKLPINLPIMTIRTRTYEGKRDRKKSEYCLDIIGTTRSIADATVIRTAYQIAEEEGFKDLTIEVNSLGDRESFARFVRELGVYFRKHMSELHPDCRHILKKGPLEAITCNHEKCMPIKDSAPHPMNYLSEPSRTHFKEVLEFLEISGLPYTINNNLIDNPESAAHTLFTISGFESGSKEPVEVVRGTRWANIAKKMGIKKDVTGVSAVVCIKNISVPKAIKQIKKPNFYLIQMGEEAKLRSLGVIEILRKAKVPVYHSLTKDKFAAQLGSAENLNVPYVLIVGQKESLENTVLVRDMGTRSQDTIRTDKIADHVKKLI